MKGFVPLTKKYPDPEQIVLIKIKPNPYENLNYYVVKYTNYNGIHSNFRFEEAGGEQYSYWEDDDILGWMPLEELDAIPFCGNEK